jgi:hypothetical protein
MADPTPAETILAFAQESMRLTPMIVLGSGASAAHGVPGMWPLAQHLLALPGVASPAAAEVTEWDAFKRKLTDGIDLESALTDVRLTKRQTDYIAAETRSFLLPWDEAVFEGILGDRRHLPLARLYRFLFASTHRQVDVVTPNYDRIAEYAADAAGYPHFSGFTSGYLQTRAATQAPRPASAADANRLVCVWKVHGSLDWFEGGNQIIGVRGMRETPNGYTPLMITPGVEKYRLAHLEPFRTVFSCSDAALERARAYFCVGYGFNDQHLQTKMVERCDTDSVPIVVITKVLSDPAKEFLGSGNCRRYLAIEECHGGSRAFSNAYPAGVEIPGPPIWALPDFLDFTLGADA